MIETDENDIIVTMNYESTRIAQKQLCLTCKKSLPDNAWFVMKQNENIYEIYCDEKCWKAKK